MYVLVTSASILMLYWGIPVVCMYVRREESSSKTIGTSEWPHIHTYSTSRALNKFPALAALLVPLLLRGAVRNTRLSNLQQQCQEVRSRNYVNSLYKRKQMYVCMYECKYTSMCVFMYLYIYMYMYMYERFISIYHSMFLTVYIRVYNVCGYVCMYVCLSGNLPLLSRRGFHILHQRPGRRLTRQRK